MERQYLENKATLLCVRVTTIANLEAILPHHSIPVFWSAGLNSANYCCVMTDIVADSLEGQRSTFNETTE